MIDRKALLADLIKQVKAVEADLGKQVKAVAEVGERLRAEYDQARKLGRTAATWNAWLDERVTQVAVAWVLGTVFVRFCEDNRLIPEPYLTGAELERRDLAESRYAQYVEDEENPTYRGWLERAFKELGAGQAGKLLFDERHNPLYQVPLSHDGARALVEFWRERDEAGDALVHDFTDPLSEDGTEGWDTRFLGDLYQDLSEAARKTYALLQTPEFVEEFILDRTMDPVVRELGGRFGELKMIDPTCGSGHFVLGAFRRMVRLWAERQPGRDVHEQVRDALNSVHGVDINPFAVAIARFRLLVAAMASSGVRTLAEASRYDWPIHLAVGDSLIKARQLELTLEGEESGDALAEFSYATEDVHEYPGILEQGRYDVVVGNPPYITVKDKNLNDLYRSLYKSCARQYALSVPFAERFFQLAKIGNETGHGYGMVGQITSNSFMKREFGRPLIEEFFGHTVELVEVIDTSGAYIPGHGTPTVILIGRRRRGNSRTDTIRAVLGIQGESGVPEVAAEGNVWKAITNQIDVPGSVSDWVSSENLARSHLATAPWSLSGGGASEIFAHLNAHAAHRASARIVTVGRYTHTGSDASYFAPSHTWSRYRVASSHIIPLVEGDAVRDWNESETTESLFPYDADLKAALTVDTYPHLRQTYAVLKDRREPGGTHAEIGLTWFEWSRWHPERFSNPLGISFAFVASHNHFVLNRGGKVFNRSAPVIKLRENATEEEYLQLLGLLNSSTSCFWLKQVSHDKGNRGGERGTGRFAWENFFEFTGTKLQEFPVPAVTPTSIVTALDKFAQELVSITPSTLTAPSAPTPTVKSLREACAKWHSTRAQMIALQEELDWQVYSLYNLHLEDLQAPESDVPELALGERAFEIVLARRVKKGEASNEWFKRHGSTPTTTLPDHWSDTYKATVQKRIDAIESSRAIGMIERPEYKRRWATEGWDSLQDKALRSWLLDRIENRDLWFQDGQPTLLTRHQLTAELSLDEDFVSVAELYEPRKELATVVEDLLTNEHVPFLPTLRYKPSGLKKRADWEHVWDLQRQEDAAPDEPAKRKIRDSIPVPPKYTSADFLKPSYWRARGKLDVPKERFISYATGAISGTPDLFGWAGWDHREQAQALSTYFTNDDGLSTEEITPLLAGLLELQPWLTQWHDEFDPLYGGSPAAFFAGYRATKQGEHGLSDDDLRAWRPAPAARRGRRPANG
ncbi:BREX-2 system adenine-specific DNA-methyltransferase PglX [Streptomyces sp. NBC_00878]|uniref:BREX-2 system adenine-specific DNA-methyltransferase PglX n=1 Tax=Streptomyces sp. NBC_00878 TaxID=2975854 RepID=UPI002252A44E|nr:BREX-2 system adenine-specific DNA-methyltransferase PglX [Streptomyces sp. NBC_00878]MCX4909566.1 BREX-2 system adenine-specific DNA-methyltransferase PglX [Streptomyces sp. NBC_00878]